VTIPEPGRIIFLNGTSSSGKSSIASELLSVLETPYFSMAVDTFNALRARERTGELTPAGLTEALRRTRLGFHRAVAGMAAGGNDLVVDHVLSEGWRLTDCLRVLDGFEVVFVGVRCPLPELVRRERARGDRDAGLAALQFDQVHAHGIYDLEVDTSVHTARECAEQIKYYLGNQPTAFDRLRELLS